MQRLEVATDVYVDRETVYEFLLSFTEYARYSAYLEEVRRHGDGSPGTEYDLEFSWWRLTYTARSAVTDVEPPGRIEWRLVDDLAARGAWVIEARGAAADDGAERAERAPTAVDGGDEGGEATDDPGTRVRLAVEYDPASADVATLGLPRLLSVDALVDRVAPLARAEAERVVERIVADLEGEPREVDLEVIERPTRG